MEEIRFCPLGLVKKYMSLRLSGPEIFFPTSRENGYTVQSDGKNTYGKVPSKIASFWACHIQKLSKDTVCVELCGCLGQCMSKYDYF